jgi:hypothetical protein
MKSLLSVVGPSTIDSQNPLSTSLERRASFWNFARADYQAAYVNHTPTLLDTEDLQVWQSCGLQVTSAESLYFDPESIKSDSNYCSSTIQLVAHTLLWLLLRTMNYLASSPTQDLTTRQAFWDQLTIQLDIWHAHLPLAFQPSAKLRHPVSRRSSTTATTSGPQPQSSNNPITELFFPIPLSAATLTLYHFARILLLLHKPTPPSPLPPSSTSATQNPPHRLQAYYHQISTQALSHAHTIIGIALGRPHFSVRVEMLLPLVAAGSCLEDDGERKVVVDVLRAVEADTGVGTAGRVGELEGEWGW